MSFWLNCRVLVPSLPLLLPHKGPFGQQSSLFWDELSVLGGSWDGHSAMTAGGQAGGGQDLGVPWGPLLAAGSRGALSVWVLGWGSHRLHMQLLAPRPRYRSDAPRAGTAPGTSSPVPPCVWTTPRVPDTAVASYVPTRPCKPVPETFTIATVPVAQAGLPLLMAGLAVPTRPPAPWVTGPRTGAAWQVE